MAKVVGKRENLLARSDDGAVRASARKKGTFVVSKGGVGPGTGFCIVGVDPGKTTGVAVWDAWDQQWYVDHIDTGRGKKVREKVHGGIRESPAKVDAAHAAGVKLSTGFNVVRGGKRKTELAMADIMEHNTCRWLCDIVMACGPRTLLVMEDFLPGVGRGQSVPAAALGLDGLSPLRILVRMHEMGDYVGLWNGDAWRRFNWGWWTGEDGRGVQVRAIDPVSGRRLRDEAGQVALPNFRDRLTRVEQWRLGHDVELRGEPAVWAGGGVSRELQQAGQRIWLAGRNGATGEQRVKEWLRAEGYWYPGRPHAMDALMHAMVGARKVQQDTVLNRQKPELIWNGNAKLRKGRITAKIG